MQFSMGRNGAVKKLTIGRPARNCFFRFGRTYAFGVVSSCSKSPRVCLPKLLVDVSDGLLNDEVRIFVQFSKNHRVGEGFGEALVIDHRTIDSEGCSPFVFIVENCFREELLEPDNVLVGDVVLK